MSMRGRFTRPLTLAAPMAVLALAAGCGDSDSSTNEAAEAEAAVTPQKALAEIEQVRAGLSAYRQGETEKAEELVGDAYLEHFENVEHPLEEADHELNEGLEELISTEIRKEMKDDSGAADVEALVAEANRGLDEAEKALKG
jgi:hypothetical protein